MSLKAFHIFFIALSVVMAFGFAAWLIDGYTKSNNMVLLLGGISSILAGAGLILYGVSFLRKLKHVSYL
jgi:hypothetical protein